MPKKVRKDETRLLRNIGDGELLCDVPGRMTVIIKPGGTIELSLAVAEHYLGAGNNGNWVEVKKEGGE